MFTPWVKPGQRRIGIALAVCILASTGLIVLLPTPTASASQAGAVRDGNDTTPRIAPTPAGWGQAIQLDSQSGTAGAPSIAIQPNGSAIVVFVEQQPPPDPNLIIYAKRFVPGSGWGVAVPYPLQVRGMNSLEVGVDRDGNALAVWVEQDWDAYPPVKTLRANRFVPASGWENGTSLADCGYDVCLPHLAMEPGGTAIVTWYYEGAEIDDYAIRFVPGSGWESPVLLASGVGWYYSPHVAMDDDGNAIAIWPQVAPDQPLRWDIYARHFAPDSGWGNATAIYQARLNETEWEPDVGMASDGTAEAVWTHHAMFEDGHFGNVIWAKHFVPGSGWGGPSWVSDPELKSNGFPAIAVARNGTAVAVWEYGSRDIWANAFTPGSGWGVPTLIDNGGDAYAVNPTVAVDGQGSAMAVWRQQTCYGCGGEVAYANHFVLGPGWGNATAVSDHSADAMNPVKIVMDVNGNALSTWGETNWTDNTGSVWARRFTAEALTPLHDAAVTQADADPRSVDVGVPVEISARIANEGTQTESVNVTVHAGSLLVGTTTVTDLAPGSIDTFSLIWDTSGLMPGSYQVQVDAEALPNETDLGDNTLLGPTIEIHPPMEATALASPAETDVGMSVAFTCSVTDWSEPYGPYEFAWDFGDGGTARGDAVAHQYEVPGTMTSTCSVVDASGGNATASVQVVVNPLPTVTATADPTAADPGMPITFTATPTGGSGGFSYIWGFGDGSSEQGAVVTHAYANPGQYTAIVTIRDSAGGVAANTATVVISSPAPPPAPLVVHAVAASHGTQVGIELSFACAAADGTPPYAFEWNFGDETGAEGAGVTHAYTSSGTKPVTCTVTDAAGNHAMSSVDVEIYSVPTVTASVDRPHANPGTDLVFTATATGGSGTFTFHWGFGDESVATGPIVSHAYASPGRYTAVVIVQDPAAGTAPNMVALTVTISDVTATAMLSTTSAVAGDTISFAAMATGGAGGPYTYDWDFGDEGTGTGATASHAYANAGTYTPKVVVTDADGITDEVVLATITVRSPSPTIQPATSSPDMTVLAVWGVIVVAASAAVAFAILRRRPRTP